MSSDPSRAIAAKLKPILAPASEKAEMLIDVLSERHGASAHPEPRGLTPTIRRLCAHYGAEAVESAADVLLERMAAWGSLRERVK